ncbi:hypothetical protein HDU96_003263 [Phlyctochytrium bullatum]|nr:hypothetical protein HDU96_003263 [Phlyctochytrium bullatum]
MRPTTAFIAVIAAVAPLASAQDLLGVIANAIQGLPSCTSSCIAQVPGYSPVLTGAFIDRFCKDVSTIATTLRSCAESSCPSPQDRTTALSFVAVLPSLCKQVPTDIASATGTITLALPSTVVAASTTSLARTTVASVPTTEPVLTKNGAEGVGRGWAVACGVAGIVAAVIAA